MKTQLITPALTALLLMAGCVAETKETPDASVLKVDAPGVKIDVKKSPDSDPHPDVKVDVKTDR